MKRIAYSFGTIVLVLVLTCCVASAGVLCVPMIDEAQMNQHLAKLLRISTAVSSLSQGKERLLIDPGVGPWPTVGQQQGLKDVLGMQAIYRFMSVFPVSSPVQANLPEISEGKILGCVSVLVSVSGSDASKAEQGVYMLFLPKPIKAGGAAKPSPLLLVSISVDANGSTTYKEVARTTIDAKPAADAATKPAHDRFPQVIASIDFITAQVHMCWKMESYSFSLKLDICYA